MAVVEDAPVARRRRGFRGRHRGRRANQFARRCPTVL